MTQCCIKSKNNVVVVVVVVAVSSIIKHLQKCEKTAIQACKKKH
jgi:hypothetical protein